MPDYVVAFHSVVAMADQFPVLSGVDLEVARGEILFVEGANGAGKTSLLRVVAGLMRPSQGDAEVLGFDLYSQARELRGHVGFVGHDSFLYGELSVRENLNFFVKATGGNLANVEASLSQLGLDGRLATVPVERLSAGQKRRATLAVALARDAELWLLDEPHTGLDSATREVFDQMIKDAAQSGRTVIFSSHEKEVADQLATRTVAMRGGSIETNLAEPVYVA